MVLRRLIGLLSACVRRLQLQDEALSKVRKSALSVASLPPLVLLQIAVHIHKALHGPLGIVGKTQFGARFQCALPEFLQNRICLFGVWEPDITAFVGRRLRTGDTFVDLGANIGYYTLLGSQLVGENGRVVAVEPSPSILAMLVANLELAGNPQNVRAIHAAVAASPGRLTVFRGPDRFLLLSSTLARRGLMPEAQVAAAPLDELLTPEELATARLVKIDVEGREFEVLAGSQRLIAHGRRDLEFLVELSPRWSPKTGGSTESAVQPLLDAGFHPYRIDNDYMPCRYLWPKAVQPPRRLRGPIKSALVSIDLVLSRIDAETL